MNRYIILTYDIHDMGGTQTYTWGKAEYLERQGWEVAIFFPGDNRGKAALPALQKYIKGGVEALSFEPYEVHINAINYALRYMIKIYGISITRNDRIIIETHYDTVALWGELLAKYISGKNMCFCCSEYFNEPRHYRRHLDFYKFKYDRGELFGISPTSISNLFDGKYDDIPNKEDILFRAFTPLNIVQDIPCEKIEKMRICDWNIVYFGRTQKHYFETIVREVAHFASDYSDKTINFILVGDVKPKAKYLYDTFSKVYNVQIIEMGDLSPVPRIVFQKSDVVIAGAGCAAWSFRSGAYTIIPDAEYGTSANGLLGYDTDNTLFATGEEKKKSFYYYLVKLLVNMEYDEKNRQQFSWATTIVSNEPDNRYEEHFELINRSDTKQSYYDIVGKKNGNTKKVSWKMTILCTPVLNRLYRISRRIYHTSFSSEKPFS